MFNGGESRCVPKFCTHVDLVAQRFEHRRTGSVRHLGELHRPRFSLTVNRTVVLSILHSSRPFRIRFTGPKTQSLSGNAVVARYTGASYTAPFAGKDR